MSTSYTFGDGDEAARRLQIVAEVFAPSTRAFLKGAVPARPLSLCVDLGCGPGYTTRLLHQTLQPTQTVGLDSSAAFVARARAGDGEPSVSFTCHDVTAMPFPVGPADLLFCRFLLSHLPAPGAALQAWGSQLRPGGLLLVEEVEWIRPALPVFSRYLEIVTAMLADQGSVLYVGPVLAAWQPAQGLVRRRSTVRRLPVSAAQAARMFVLNLRSWRDRPFIRAHVSPAELAGVEGELQALAAGSGGPASQWGLRQIVFEAG